MKQIYARNGPIRVLILLGCLSLSLLVLGGSGSFLVWRLSDAYDEMVSRELPLQAHLRNITSISNLTRRALNSAIQSASAGRATDETLERFRATVLINNGNFDAMRSLLLNQDEGYFLALHTKRELYLNAGDYLLGEVDSLAPATIAARREELDRLFGTYLDQQDALANHLGQEASERGRKMIQQAKLLTVFFIIVALWPAIVAASFFGYLSVTTMLAFFRNR